MLIPLDLSGGTGSCLWPASRVALPTPFIRFSGGEILLQHKPARAAALVEATEVITVTNRNPYSLTRDEYGDSSAPELSHDYLPESAGRNTAPAIAAAAACAAVQFGRGYQTPGGTCIREFIDGDDWAEAHLRALEYPGLHILSGLWCCRLKVVLSGWERK